MVVVVVVVVVVGIAVGIGRPSAGLGRLMPASAGHGGLPRKSSHQVG